MTADQDGADSITVLLVDDQPLLRHSLRIIIDTEPDLRVVAEASTGQEAITAARQVRPDVILMDIRMPGTDGIRATAAITADPTLTSTRILALSMFELDEYVYGALRAGASGFLLKDGTPAELTEAVRRVHGGESLFAPAILQRLIGAYIDTASRVRTGKLDQLTARESEVLTLVARGLSNADIADALVLSQHTIKTHIGNLLAKLNARDRAHLVIAAYESGLVSPGGSE